MHTDLQVGYRNLGFNDVLMGRIHNAYSSDLYGVCVIYRSQVIVAATKV